MSTPHSQHGKKQLSTIEANDSRLCAKIRWIVESENRSIKRIKYFQTPVSSILGVPNLFDDLKIVSAIHNRYFRRIYSDSDNPEVAKKLLRKVNTPNVIQEVVESEKLTRRNIIFEHFD